VLRMYDWNAPATLAYWPGQADLPEKACATLTEAIREADASDGRTPWIITQNGEILVSRKSLRCSLKARAQPRAEARVPPALAAFSPGLCN